MDPELRPELLRRHRRALDVPARTPDAPRRLPRRVLPVLRRLPEREVARILLRAGSAPAPRPDRAAGRTARRRSRTERRGSRRRRSPCTHDRSPAAPRSARRSPASSRWRAEARRASRDRSRSVSSRYQAVASRARSALAAGRGLVDLVVDVGDVVHEPYLVAPLAQPPRQPREDDERPGVADVGPLVDGRTADVHPDRLGRRRELDERARQRVLQTHSAIVVGRDSASASPLRPPHALERLARRQRKRRRSRAPVPAAPR